MILPGRKSPFAHRRRRRVLWVIGWSALIAALPGAVVEEGGFVLLGETPEALLAVRELLRGADATWRGRGIAEASGRRQFPLELRVDGDGADFTWTPQTSVEGVTLAVARHWLELRLGAEEARRQWEAQPWVLDWMVGVYLSQRDPMGTSLWVARAGERPEPTGRLLHRDLPSDDALQAQRWLLGEWWTQAAGLVPLRQPMPASLEADWVAYFLSRTAKQDGPFLSLAESSRRIETLGQVMLVINGHDERRWLSTLSRSLLPETEWSRRQSELSVLRESIHPVFHRALVSLLGACAPKADQAAFAKAFEQSWAEARQTAAEIQALLRP